MALDGRQWPADDDDGEDGVQSWRGVVRMRAAAQEPGDGPTARRSAFLEERRPDEVLGMLAAMLYRVLSKIGCVHYMPQPGEHKEH